MILEYQRMQMLAGLITESQYKNCLLLENEKQEVDNLEKKLKQDGKDLNDPKVAASALNQFIEKGFEIDKINPKAIKEIDLPITESGGGTLSLAIDALEKIEVLNVLAQKLGVSPKILEKSKLILQKIGRIANFPFRLIEKAFYGIARMFGFKIENAKIAGIGGLTLLGIVLATVAAIHLPGLIAGLATAKGILLLFGGLSKLGAAAYSIVKNLFRGKKEQTDKFYTTSDFLADLEKLTGKKIPTKVVYQFSDWIDTFKDNKDQMKIISNLLKSIKNKIANKQDPSSEIKQIIQINIKDKNDFTDKINLFFNNLRIDLKK